MNYYSFLDGISTDDDDDDGDEEQTETHDLLFDQLAVYAKESNTSIANMDKLLKILSPYHPELPKSAKTLLKCATKATSKVVSCTGGKFVYFGIESSLKSLLLQPQSDIKLTINIDGLPISKSSGTSFWPILARSKILASPFLIAVFCGTTKPVAEEFLLDFVAEAVSLEQNGLFINDQHCRFSILNFICDAPAKSFIKAIKSHSGYFSCNNCTVEGDYQHNRVVFRECNARLRTDDDFREQVDENHHRGRSHLLPLNIDMVLAFPMDYMHAVLLGTVKRILNFLLGGPLICRQPSATISNISTILVSLKPFVPSEFTRKSRSLAEMKYWKATEFRLFLLYSGIVALRNNVPDDIYHHFLLLHCAITLMSHPQLTASMIQSAQQCLLQFVESAKDIYGSSFYSYNIHSLIHLHQDCTRFGSIDEFSAFEFENCLGRIKRKLKSGYLPLEQLTHFADQINAPAIVTNSNGFHQEHHNGSIATEECSFTQFKCFKQDSIKFALNKKDCYFLSKSGHICQIVNILKKSSGPFFVVKYFSNCSPFFSSPCNLPSSAYCVRDLSDDIVELPLAEVDKKLCAFPYLNDKFVVIPIIHS